MLKDTFTSTGAKFFAHEEAMRKLQNGQGQPIVTHVMLTDVCNHSCAFCSVQARAGDSLDFADVVAYLGILQSFGLKAVILSGGGNPILYKCKRTGKDFNDVVDMVHSHGLEIGLITNGMPLRLYKNDWIRGGWREMADGYSDPKIQEQCGPEAKWRKSWKTVKPETLDKCTWIRISLAGLDHDEHEVYVPDIDESKTWLGFSYVGHDIYKEPLDQHHGKVSRKEDLLSGDKAPDWTFEERRQELTEQIASYVERYKPKYVRLLPNCLEPPLIKRRCDQMQFMAAEINDCIGSEVVFVQYKPPAPPKACYLGYIHPVLNCDGYVYPCDSCVLNEDAEHSFAKPWRVCRWDEVASLYEKPIYSLVDPQKLCPGCVFTHANEILTGVVEGSIQPTVPAQVPSHVNFV